MEIFDVLEKAGDGLFLFESTGHEPSAVKSAPIGGQGNSQEPSAVKPFPVGGQRNGHTGHEPNEVGGREKDHPIALRPGSRWQRDPWQNPYLTRALWV